MVIHSDLPKNAYLAAMKSQMENHIQFGSERFTGYFWGGLFSVTYHSGYEYDRRYSNPKNSALGYVRKCEDGCRVHFIRLKGILNPPTYLFVSTVLTLALLFQCAMRSVLISEVAWLCFALGFGVTAIAAPISAFFESVISERSAEGGRVLLSFLLDPSDPYANYHKIP